MSLSNFKSWDPIIDLLLDKLLDVITCTQGSSEIWPFMGRDVDTGTLEDFFALSKCRSLVNSKVLAGLAW